jgi:hypothetical protein
MSKVNLIQKKPIILNRKDFWDLETQPFLTSRNTETLQKNDLNAEHLVSIFQHVVNSSNYKPMRNLILISVIILTILVIPIVSTDFSLIGLYISLGIALINLLILLPLSIIPSIKSHRDMIKSSRYLLKLSNSNCAIDWKLRLKVNLEGVNSNSLNTNNSIQYVDFNNLHIIQIYNNCQELDLRQEVYEPFFNTIANEVIAHCNSTKDSILDKKSKYIYSLVITGLFFVILTSVLFWFDVEYRIILWVIFGGLFLSFIITIIVLIVDLNRVFNKLNGILKEIKLKYIEEGIYIDVRNNRQLIRICKFNTRGANILEMEKFMKKYELI